MTPERIDAIYRRLAPDVHRFLARRTFGKEVATDLLGETFTRALADRARLRGTTDEELIAWIYQIARNQLIDHQRRDRVERDALRRLGMQRQDAGTEAFEDVEREIDREGVRAEVTAAIDALPEAQRIAVRMRIVEDRSYADVAAALDTTEQNARARVSRALRALRDGDALRRLADRRRPDS